MSQTIRPKDPNVRSLPYPFLAGLSISSDIEFFDFDVFETFYKFLNTNQPTLLGTGLGLEITSSFFFYSAHSYTFSYFNDIQPNSKLSPKASRIKDYLISGWMDTNHAYGDFDFVGGFTRNHALDCYEALDKLGVRIDVFTNHGGLENIQNVGTDAAYHCGDLKDNFAYHADLMKQHGVRYIWTDSLVMRKNIFWKRWLKRLLNKPHQYQQVLHNLTLQDNSQFQGFVRFGSTGYHNAPNLSSLGEQLRQLNWDYLYKNQEAVILYQHLGVLGRNGGKCLPTDLEAISSRPEVFLAPFYFLQRESKEGRLWVCGVSRLLNYINIVESVKISYNAERDRHELLYSESVTDPQTHFQGLTFYIQPNQSSKVYYNDVKLLTLVNGLDETGKYSITVPLKKLENIW